MGQLILHGKHGFGKVTIVDDEDFAKVKRVTWYVTKNGYVHSKGRLLHRLIMETPNGLDTDHINHDKLDNRRINLRVASRSQNNWNGGKKRNNTSGYKGVRFFKRDGNWQARIWKDWKEYHLGYFDTPEEAAMAYNRAAKKMHGVYARPNKV